LDLWPSPSKRKKGIHPFPGPVFYTPPSVLYSWLGGSPPRCNHNIPGLAPRLPDATIIG
jgi:hypothetical protein